MPRVLGVREPRPRLDDRAPAEEVSELDEHEGEEEQVEQREDDCQLGRAEPEPRPNLHPDRRRPRQVLAQEPGAYPAEDDDQADVERELARVRNSART